MAQFSDTPGPQSSNGTRGRSHLAAGAQLAGDLAVPGMVELLGKVDGKVTADEIVVEVSGTAEGELHAAVVAVKGRFSGKIVAGEVRLNASSHVSGDISYGTLTIESGAEVDVTCSHKAAGT